MEEVKEEIRPPPLVGRKNYLMPKENLCPPQKGQNKEEIEEEGT